MKASKYIVCIFLSLFCLNSPAKTIADLVYVIDQFEPYNYQSEDGHINGFAVEILNKVWEKLDIPPQKIHVYPWARGYKLAKNQKNTLLFSTTRSKSREHQFKWACPIGNTRIVLIARHSKNIKIQTIDEAKRYKTVAIMSDIGHQMLQKNHFDNTKIELSNLLDNALIMLSKGRVDFISISESIALPKLVKMGESLKNYQIVWVLEEFPICFAFNPETDDALVKMFQEALDEVHETPNFVQALKKKYHLVLE